MQKFFQVTKKIYLADTDVTGIAYYARHLEWLEMARIDFIGEIYKPLTRMIAEDKISFMPITVRIDYKAPAAFEDILTIKLFIKGIEKIKLILGYLITKEDQGKEILVSEAEITMLCISVDPEKGTRPAKIPSHLVELFKDWEVSHET